MNRDILLFAIVAKEFCAIYNLSSTPPPLFFLCSKKKKGWQRKKRRDLKAETIKRLTPWSKYYYFNHSRASRIRKFFLSAIHGGRQYFPLFHDPTSPPPPPALFNCRLILDWNLTKSLQKMLTMYVIWF